MMSMQTLGDFAAQLETPRPPEPVFAPEPEGPPQKRTVTVDAPELDMTPRHSLGEARALLAREIREYLNDPFPNYVLLVRASPGVGKTHAAVHAAEIVAADGLRVMYAGPRHDFYKDVLAVAKNRDYWYEWLPRQDGDDVKQQTCIHTGAVNQWAQKGYEAMDFCKSVCGWDFVNNGCIWHQQKKRAEKIIFCQHQHVIAHPLKFNVVIGDENPTSAFMHEWKLQAKHVMPSGMDPTEDLTHILHSLTAIVAMSTLNKPLEGPELLAALGGADRVLNACKDFVVDPEALIFAPEIHQPEDVDKADTFHLPALVALLVREASAHKMEMDYLHRVIVADGQLMLLLRRKISKELPPHIIWLDATGEPRIYESLFDRPVKVVDANPKLRGKIYQVTVRANGKGAITGDKDQAKRWRKQLIEQIEAIRERGYKRPALITFQSIKGEIEMESLHFYASRGTNQFKDCDCMIIAGAPQPALPEITKIARMIFFDRDVAFNGEWSSILRTYNHITDDVKGRAREIGGYWADADLEAVLWSVREAELIQSAHRSRPVSNTCDVWLLTNIPVDALAPDFLLDFDGLFGVPEEAQALGINAFLWRDMQKGMEVLKSDKRPITPKMLADYTGISIPTIRKVFHELKPARGTYFVGSLGGRPTGYWIIEED